MDFGDMTCQQLFDWWNDPENANDTLGRASVISVWASKSCASNPPEGGYHSESGGHGNELPPGG